MEPRSVPVPSETSNFAGVFEKAFRTIREYLTELKNRDLLKYLHDEDKRKFQELSKRVSKLLASARNDKLKALFFGKTGTGKSAVLNALLRSDELPSACGQVTNSLCCIEGSDSDTMEYTKRDRTGHEEKGSLPLRDVLRSFENGVNASSLIRVQHPRRDSPLLCAGVALYDSPGVDADKELDAFLKESCSDADVFVYVCDSTCTIENTEKEYLLQVKKRFSTLTPRNLFIVFNQWDMVCAADDRVGAVRAQHLQKASKFLREKFDFESDSVEKCVFFISAKDSRDLQKGNLALEDLAVSRKNCHAEFQAFEDRLQECLTTYSRDTKFRRHQQTVKSCCEEAVGILKRAAEVVQKERDDVEIENQAVAQELRILQDEMMSFESALDTACHQATEKINQQFEFLVKETKGTMTYAVEEFVGEFEKHCEEDYKRDLIHHLQGKMLASNETLHKKMKWIYKDEESNLKSCLSRMNTPEKESEDLSGFPHFATKAAEVDISSVLGLLGFIHFLLSPNNWGNLGGLKTVGVLTVVLLAGMLGIFGMVAAAASFLPCLGGTCFLYKSMVWYFSDFRKQAINQMVLDHVLAEINSRKQSIRQGCSKKIEDSLRLLEKCIPTDRKQSLCQKQNNLQEKLEWLGQQNEYLRGAIVFLQQYPDKCGLSAAMRDLEE